jgi:hypothetical protein
MDEGPPIPFNPIFSAGVAARLLISTLVMTAGSPMAAAPTDTLESTAGPALMCDTPQELNRFVELVNQGRQALNAVGIVNTEAHDPSACGNVMAAFEVGKPVSTMTMLGQLVSIVAVTVTAINDGDQWFAVKPSTHYTIRGDSGEPL